MSKSGKLKPNKGVLKRIRVTAKGHFKRRRAGMRHLNSHFTGDTRRKLRGTAICPPCEEKRLRRILHMPLPRKSATPATESND